FSPMYALCAYVLGYYWNTMWLDTVALMPLVIAGTVGVLRDRKFSLYIISLAVSIIASFYIGYMVCLFVLIFSICYTVVSFVSVKESLKNALRMVLYSLVALMITAVVTVPAFMALQQSDSAGSAGAFPTQYTINYAYGYTEHNLINTLMAVLKTATHMMSAMNPIKMDQGMPNIACGMLTLTLIPFYFVTKKIKLKEKIVSICLLVFFLVSFVVNQLNYIWHAMATPAMVYYRWSFIFSFAVIIMAYRAYILMDSFGKKTIMLSGGLLAAYLVLSFFLQNKLRVVLTGFGVAVIFIGIILNKTGRMKKKTLALLLCLFVICDMGVNTFVGVRFVGSTRVDDYPMDAKDVEVLIDTAKEQSDGEIFRTEFLKSQTLNDGALNLAYGITTFNSMVDSSYADTLKEMGLASSKGNNRYEYAETNPVTNMFLNIKYLIGRDGQTSYDKVCLEEIAERGESTLYENKAYVPMGFMTDVSLLEYAPKSTWRFPGEVLNDWFKTAAGINENVFLETEPVGELGCTAYEDKLSVRLENPNSYRLDLSNVKGTEGEEPPLMYLEYTIEEEGAYYGLFRASTDKNTTVIINGDEENSREISQNYSNFVSIGTFKKGDRIRVEMEAEFEKPSNVNCRLARLDEDVLYRGVEKLRECAMSTTEWSDTTVKGTIDVKKPGLFYTSVLYCGGWEAYVDGKEVEITPVGDTFIAFELSEGEHEIKLEYNAPGLKAGILISVVGIVAFALLCVSAVLVRRKRKTATCEEGCCAELSKDTDFEDSFDETE
ncbi:MAG: YfhO family protein, partial [Ruminococcus sp.]|nr:YfhO family protein [Ruminococcus sp.]